MTPVAPTRNKVFISYSHADREWLQCVRTHLRPLERRRRMEIDVWDDSEIRPGSDWRAEIAQAIASARAVVLLVSPNFLASDFIADEEVPPLLEAARDEGAAILPVIISHSQFAKTPGLSHLQTVNDPATPLINMTQGQQDEVFVKLADAIEHAFEQPPRHEPAAAVRAVPRQSPPHAPHALEEIPQIKTTLDALRQRLRNYWLKDEALCAPAVLIAESVLLGGLRAVARRANPKLLARSMSESAMEVEQYLRSGWRPLDTKEQKSQLLRYAAAGDYGDYWLANQALNHDDYNYSVLIEHTRLPDDVIEKTPGTRFESGYLSQEFVGEEAAPETTLRDVFLLITDEEISAARSVLPVLSPLFGNNPPGAAPPHSLLIIAADLTGEALQSVLPHKTGGIVAVKPTSYSVDHATVLTDIAVLTGGRVLGDKHGVPLESARLDDLGRADRVVVSSSDTFIVGARGARHLVEQHVKAIRESAPRRRGSIDLDRGKTEERARRLAGGVTVVKVSGATPDQRRRRADKFAIMLSHFEAGRLSGVVAGEHLALVNAAAQLRGRGSDTNEGKLADAIVADALEAPFRRMAEGLARDPDELLRAVRARQQAESNLDIGYYGDEDSIVDLFKAGAFVPLLDVSSLMREAVEAAAQSIASLRFTDEVVRQAAAVERP